MLLGGMFALGAQYSPEKDKYMTLAADIAHTCHESYDRAGKLVDYSLWCTHRVIMVLCANKVRFPCVFSIEARSRSVSL
jgi:hypothetical protein